ncbi:MAG: hypothetical protein ABT940_11160, partial [Alphaproteobacteria bacterium]
YSLNLNIGTILSEDFLTYDQSLPPRVRRQHIIEVSCFDLLENAQNLPFLHWFLKNRGYRLCVDGVSPEQFMIMDWPALEVDMIKLRWTASFADGNDAAFRQKVTEVAATANQELVLCRCDDQTAVDWGADAGISVFQGWYLDGLRKPKPDQPPARYRLRP